ncbi:MAG: hypothetical protein P8046_12725 [Anaerolineales bacterium]
MDLLGVGPLELGLILLIVFLVIGPKRGVNQITKEVRTLPNTLMREAELEDLKKEMEKDTKEIRNVSKEFNVDVPDWRKSAQKEVSASQSAPKSTSQPEPDSASKPNVEPDSELAPEPEAEQPSVTEEEKE